MDEKINEQNDLLKNVKLINTENEEMITGLKK